MGTCEQAKHQRAFQRPGSAVQASLPSPAEPHGCRAITCLARCVLLSAAWLQPGQLWLMPYCLVQCCASRTCQSSAAARRAPARSRSTRSTAYTAHRPSAPSTTWCVHIPKLALSVQLPVFYVHGSRAQLNFLQRLQCLPDCKTLYHCLQYITA